MSAIALTKTCFRKQVPALPSKPFEIISLGRSEENENTENNIFRNTGTFKICWLTGGRIRGRVDLQVFNLGPDSFLCIKPGKMVCFDQADSPAGYILSFTPAFMNGRDQEFDPNYQQDVGRVFSLSSVIPAETELKPDMQGIAERMEKEFENIFLYREQILTRYLKIFLIFLSRHGVEMTTGGAHSRSTELSHEFMGLLEKNYKDIRSITDYARKLSVTPNHLNVVVKRNTGQTAGYHVKQRLILEAKRLAVYSSLCMKEIAGELGFSDPAHFSKFFKNSSGINFSDFKKEYVRFPMSLVP